MSYIHEIQPRRGGILVENKARSERRPRTKQKKVQALVSDGTNESPAEVQKPSHAARAARQAAVHGHPGTP